MSTPAQLSIVPRQLLIDLEDCRSGTDWAGDPVTSTYIAAMSTMFPRGERLFIEVMRHYQDRITDPVLRQHVRGFIGQEARHAIVHEKMNEWFGRQGFPMERALGIADWGVDWLQKYLPRRSQLGVTMAVEHFTTQFCDSILRNKKLTDRMDLAMGAIWEWHSLEEAEHKAVAHDLFSHLGSGYLNRLFHLLLGTLLFVPIVFVVQFVLLKGTGNLRWSVLNEGHRQMWGKGPDTHGMGAQMMEFFWGGFSRRNFHPFDHNDAEMMRRTHERLQALGVFRMTPQRGDMSLSTVGQPLESSD